MKNKFDPEKNYRRFSSTDVLTGKQVLYMWETAIEHKMGRVLAAMILDLAETEKKPNRPDLGD